MATARKCKHCRTMLDGSDSSGAPAATGPVDADVLETHWYAIIWGSLVVPCVGVWIIVFLSSIMYYLWRGNYPEKARTINLHGWLAWLAGNAIWGLIFYVFRGN